MEVRFALLGFFLTLLALGMIAWGQGILTLPYLESRFGDTAGYGYLWGGFTLAAFGTFIMGYGIGAESED